MARTFAMLAGLSGALAVILGAFAAHALKARLAPEHLATFETGVRYQMYHTLAILLIAALASRGGTAWLSTSALLFAAGILLFSGSLYLLATRELLGIGSWRWLGPVTPLGGLCFIAGWIALALGAAIGKAP
jgi:uncharacterized membrane protein YgdD (TMEM256/DUF423 family)